MPNKSSWRHFYPAPSATPNGAFEALSAVPMLDLLACDPRPTFVLDTEALFFPNDIAFRPVYWNPAMAAIEPGSPLRAIIDIDARNKYDSFIHSSLHTWILDTSEPTCTSFLDNGFKWTKLRVADRWSVISGMPIVSTSLEERPLPDRTASQRKFSDTQPIVDWTDILPPKVMSPHVAWARSIKWSQTPLGPMHSWSPQFRSYANLVMQDPRPAVIFLGPELILVYNEPYIELLGEFHPCMGVGARTAFPKVWDTYFEHLVQRNLLGETVELVDTSIQMIRNGYMEETYFTFKFIPILDSEGATIGHYEPLVETTKAVISHRQSRTLLDLSEEIPRARTSDSFWDLATNVLNRNAKDIPFALLYSLKGGSTSLVANRTQASESSHHCTLRGSFGVPEDAPARSTTLDLQQDSGFAPYFRQALIARRPIIAQLEQCSETAEFILDLNRKDSEDPCRAAAICPLDPTSSEDGVLGFIVIGLNPHRPFDDVYNQFILVASRLLSTSLSSILMHEDEIDRAERMKLELKKELHKSQKEVERSTLKFQRFAERADIAIFILDMEGVYSYRNDAWFSIFDPEDRDVKLAAAWDALIDPDFIFAGKAKFEALMNTKEHQSFELRLTRTWDVPGPSFDDSLSQQQPMWVLTSIFPELSEEGEVLEIIGCCTDISKQKWAEKVQATQASSAQEAKRQLENFIDTTSHEMRNPLSAIAQCADSIIATHKTYHTSTDYQQMLEVAVDAADTIVQCSKHMKTIVDDVLTMSKLDSGLFVMTPGDVHLKTFAKDAVRMFDVEAKAAGVDLDFRLEDSSAYTDIDYVSLDSTRVLQVLINLITNAIKFTRLEKTRQISVSLGISREQPTHDATGTVAFLTSSKEKEAQSLLVDWAKGEPVYVIFSVKDTGRGLSDAEHALLFARFSQASPRTHINYGGSGLGLFISRRLTEMHGGEIGFTSQFGVGSIFSFYVKGRKSTSTRQQMSPTSAVFSRNQDQPLQLRHIKSEPHRPPLQSKLSQKDLLLSNLHVLVVEDNVVNQRVLAKQLRNLGMHVGVANHGKEALDYLSTTDYCIQPSPSSSPSSSTSPSPSKPLSLILLDCEMPVMGGLECVRRIRELQAQGVVKGHVPVIAVTANVRPEQVKTALGAGMDDVISKPFRIPELLACMKKTLVGTGML